MMELSLNRVDYTQVSVTSPRCMILLPSSSNHSTQKIVVADNDGIINCFGFKKGEIQTSFKTLPGPAVTKMCLGGVADSAQDKIFISCGNQVRGYTKKGKQFLMFDTNLTETIQSMYVVANDLFIAGDFIYNHYRDCQDQNYYLCGEKINDILVLPLNKVKILTPILACEDRVLRLLSVGIKNTISFNHRVSLISFHCH
ncbi:BBS7 (predicted) [Pycnogonum litorale]